MTDGAPDEIRPVTIFDVQPDPKAKVVLRDLPRLTRTAIEIAWQAGRGEFLASTLLQLAGGLGIGLLLLLGQRGLEALLDAVQTEQSLSAVLPWVLAIGAVVTVASFVTSVQRERQEILGELMSRHVEQKVLDATGSVDLLAFENPSFHNRVQRMRMSGLQPLNLVFGLSGLIRAAVGVLGVVIALIAIEPLLVAPVCLVFLPAWLVASRRGEAYYRFFWRMTPRDRERTYVSSVLSDRDTAKEVRAFGLAHYLRRRYDELYDERMSELRLLASRQLRNSLVANVGIGVVLVLTLLLGAWATLNGGIPVASAGIAIAGIAIIGERLTSAGFAAGTLSEAGLYVADYSAFVSDLTGREPSRTSTGPAPAGFSALEVDGLAFRYPTGETPALEDVSLRIEAGKSWHWSGRTARGRPRWQSSSRGSTSRPRAPSAATASTSRRSTPLPCAAPSRSSSRTSSDSTSALATTSASAASRTSMTSRASGRPRSTPTRTASSPRWRRATGRCSVRSSSAVPTSPSASGNGSRWRAPSSAVPPSSSSTNRRPRWTRVPSTSCSCA